MKPESVGRIFAKFFVKLGIVIGIATWGYLAFLMSDEPPPRVSPDAHEQVIVRADIEIPWPFSSRKLLEEFYLEVRPLLSKTIRL